MPKRKQEIQTLFSDLVVAGNKARYPSLLAPEKFKLLEKALKQLGGVYHENEESKDPFFEFPGLDSDQISGLISPQGADFYPTPKWLIHEMIELADISRAEFILDPAAGDGAILKEVELTALEEGYGIELYYAETNPHFRNHLSGHDSLYELLIDDYNLIPPNPIWDVILTNPNFAGAGDHVQQMASRLNMDGRLIAVVPESLFTLKGEADFREWIGFSSVDLDNLKSERITWWTANGFVWHVKPLPTDTFEDWGMNARTVLLWATRTEEVEKNPYITRKQIIDRFKGEDVVIPEGQPLKDNESGFAHVKENLIASSPFQPRKEFEGIQSLAEDIERTGLIHRPIVRLLESGKYELVVGERRVRAMRHLGWDEIPCEVRELTDQQAMAMTLMENTSREDLTPAEECSTFNLLQAAGHSIPEIAAVFGKTENYVFRRMKLAELIPEAMTELEQGAMNIGHAEELARLEKPSQEQVLKWLVQSDWRDKDEDGNGIRYSKSIRELRLYIKKEVMNDLRDVPWELTREFDNAPACSRCHKNTACNSSLFDDLVADSGRCLDAKCLKSKHKEYRQNLIQAAEKELAGKYKKFTGLALVDYGGTSLVPKGTIKVRELPTYYFPASDDPRRAVCENLGLAVVLSVSEWNNDHKLEIGNRVPYCLSESKECKCGQAELLEEVYKKQAKQPESRGLERINYTSTRLEAEVRISMLRDKLYDQSRSQAVLEYLWEKQPTHKPGKLEIGIQLLYLMQGERGGLYSHHLAELLNVEAEHKKIWDELDDMQQVFDCLFPLLMKRTKRELERFRDVAILGKALGAFEGLETEMSDSLQSLRDSHVPNVNVKAQDYLAAKLIDPSVEQRFGELEAKAKAEGAKYWELEKANQLSFFFVPDDTVRVGPAGLIEHLARLMTPYELRNYLHLVASMVGMVEAEIPEYDYASQGAFSAPEMRSWTESIIPIIQAAYDKAIEEGRELEDITHVGFLNAAHVLHWHMWNALSVDDWMKLYNPDSRDDKHEAIFEGMMQHVSCRFRSEYSNTAERFSREWWEGVLESLHEGASSHPSSYMIDRGE